MSNQSLIYNLQSWNCQKYNAGQIFTQDIGKFVVEVKTGISISTQQVNWYHMHIYGET